MLPALFWQYGSESLIASLCKIEFLCALGDPNFMGSLVLAMGFVIFFFALIAVFLQGQAGKLISCSIAFVVLLAIWKGVLDA